MGKVNEIPKQGVPVAPQNGDIVTAKLKKTTHDYGCLTWVIKRELALCQGVFQQRVGRQTD